MPPDERSDPDAPSRLSRRRILGGFGAIGAAGALGGAATTSLLWDEEKFGNVTNPNLLRGGELDLKVDWTVNYYDWIDATPRTIAESDLTDQPGPIVTLEDVKPGDVIEKTLSAHVFGNPAFLSAHCEIHADDDNGFTEPEDTVDSHTPNDSDGTPSGDLGDSLRMVAWFDDGDGLPREVWAGDFPDTEDDYLMAVGDAEEPSHVFDLDAPDVIAAGTLTEVCQGRHLLDPRVNGHVANTFPNSLCYQNSETEYIGVLAWVPRDIPGVNDNVIQTDRLEYQFGFDAIQCRHNVSNSPIDGSIYQADAENNAQFEGVCREEIEDAQSFSEERVCATVTETMVCPHNDVTYTAPDACQIEFLEDRGWKTV